MKTTILLIDDDETLTTPLSRSLLQYGFEVNVAHDGKRGLEMALSAPPDLVLLDVMMPVMDGWAVCRELREKSNVPIVMLTALGEEVDRILGLELGADDYLTKPFSTRELIARIKAMLRRIELDQAVIETEVTQLSQAGVTLDLDARRAFNQGAPLELRYKEFELLALLISKAGSAVTRAEIFDKVWGTDWLGDTRTLDVHIRWLRGKIEADPSNPELIQTVRGVGYRFTG